MALYFASLNSGSNGNCYYIGNSREAVLIDAGISCRETERRMDRLRLPVTDVRAIFISHEHTDHTSGAEVLSRRYHIPVFISEPTYGSSKLNIHDSLRKPLQAHSTVRIGDLIVKAFPKRHDASDPLSFTVTGDGKTVGVFTDIGSQCENLIEHFSQCHVAFLETNYDEKMLLEGSYPWFLKNRIRGDHGHLANHQALELFTTHRSPSLSHLFLSHLSRDNNDPQQVHELFLQHAGPTSIVVASRYEESAVYCI